LTALLLCGKAKANGREIARRKWRETCADEGCFLFAISIVDRLPRNNLVLSFNSKLTFYAIKV